MMSFYNFFYNIILLTWEPLSVLFLVGKLLVKVLVAQACLTLCNPRDSSLPGFFVHGLLQAKNIGVSINSLLQGIFSTQELNLGLLNCIGKETPNLILSSTEVQNVLVLKLIY